jgi:hypothetical protein
LLGTQAIVGQDQAQIVDDYFAALGFGTPLAPDRDTHDTPIQLRLDALYPRELPAQGAGVDAAIAGSDHFAVWLDVQVDG